MSPGPAASVNCDVLPPDVTSHCYRRVRCWCGRWYCRRHGDAPRCPHD
jgi:hypothetical protein